MRTAASIEARVGARQRPTHGRSMAPTRGRESSGLLRLSSRGGTRIPDPVINRQVRPYYGLRDRSKDRSTRQRLTRGSEGRRVRKSQDHLDPEVVSHKHFRPVGTTGPPRGWHTGFWGLDQRPGGIVRQPGRIVSKGEGKWLVRVFVRRDAGGKRGYTSKTIRAPELASAFSVPAGRSG